MWIVQLIVDMIESGANKYISRDVHASEIKKK